MKPVRHPSNNRTLGAPAGWDQSKLPVEALGITDTELEGVPCGRPDPGRTGAHRPRRPGFLHPTKRGDVEP